MGKNLHTEIKIGIVGLGYVGLPLALAFAKKFSHVVGFDIDTSKVNALKQGIDVTNEGCEEELKQTKLVISSKSADLANCNFFVVAVPTPVDENHSTDLRAVMKACATVGLVLKRGGVVVFESTVYPGVTEEICGPILEHSSGLKASADFKLAYSPERINPGDKEHSLENVIKIVSGEDEETLDLVAQVYGEVVRAGVYRAPSIKVAEAAKVIENTQRDLNIALMNELAIIFDRMNISTKEVLAAAGSKWNFLKFSPGLVGGHCIGVDPYYLTTKAEQLRYYPQLILAGRRVNDGMGFFVAQRLMKCMINQGFVLKGAKVGILGLTFKENVSDIRNSRVPDIMSELNQYGISPLLHDPRAIPEEVAHEYKLSLSAWDDLRDLDGMILAVSHSEYLDMPMDKLCGTLKKGGVLIDVKSVLPKEKIRKDLVYWSL